MFAGLLSGSSTPTLDEPNVATWMERASVTGRDSDEWLPRTAVSLPNVEFLRG